MFSGIVETIGLIIKMTLENGCKHFVIEPKLPLTDLMIGDSIAVNGVCLTITKMNTDVFHVTAVPETLRLTTLDHLQENDTVNLERALTLNSRLGGHYVQGHIDGLATITNITHDHSDALLVTFEIPSTLNRYLVKKGFITIDGMSITIVDTDAHWFSVTFIPHTQAVTGISQYRIGTKVNIEVDIMAKYAEKLLGVHL